MDINTFNFKTLYTKIPHDKLKENLNIFIFVSVQLQKQALNINIGDNSAQFSDKKRINMEVLMKRIL